MSDLISLEEILFRFLGYLYYPTWVAYKVNFEIMANLPLVFQEQENHAYHRANLELHGYSQGSVYHETIGSGWLKKCQVSLPWQFFF